VRVNPRTRSSARRNVRALYGAASASRARSSPSELLIGGVAVVVDVRSRVVGLGPLVEAIRRGAKRPAGPPEAPCKLKPSIGPDPRTAVEQSERFSDAAACRYQHLDRDDSRSAGSRSIGCACAACRGAWATCALWVQEGP
jgi:hypothetical protein